MTWLERVRHKNFSPDTSASAKSAKSLEGDHRNLEAYESSSDKSAKSHDGPTSVTFGTPEGLPREVSALLTPTLPCEAITVAHQRIFFDFDVPDGTYTPQELQRAKLVIKRGPVLRYRLHWPGDIPQPIVGRETTTTSFRRSEG